VQGDRERAGRLRTAHGVDRLLDDEIANTADRDDPVRPATTRPSTVVCRALCASVVVAASAADCEVIAWAVISPSSSVMPAARVVTSPRAATSVASTETDVSAVRSEAIDGSGCVAKPPLELAEPPRAIAGAWVIGAAPGIRTCRAKPAARPSGAVPGASAAAAPKPTASVQRTAVSRTAAEMPMRWRTNKTVHLHDEIGVAFR
jgi:hypothetical protein